MNEQEKAKLIAELKKLDSDKTAQLCAHYENVINEYAKRQKLDSQRIKGLLEANAKAQGVTKQVAPKLPRSFKPGRAGGNPETN
jgi:hypothetical protein